MVEYWGRMSDSPLCTAHRHLGAAVEELAGAVNGATDNELLSALTLCEGLLRRRAG